MTPKVFKFVRPLIGISYVIFSFLFLILLLFTEIPSDNKDIINITIGFVLVGLGTILNYYFGTSKDKSDSDQKATYVEPPVGEEPPKV